MELKRQLIISPDRIMDLAMDLATLLHSHENMCNWLGPYAKEPVENDYIASHYKSFFEERLGYLLLTLASLLRTLDDRKEISNYTRKQEPKNIELATVQINGKAQPVEDFREVLNFIIHAFVAIPEFKDQRHVNAVKIKHGKSDKEYTFQWNVRVLNGRIQIQGKRNGRGVVVPMNLNLVAFCDMAFRVVEDIRSRNN